MLEGSGWYTHGQISLSRLSESLEGQWRSCMETGSWPRDKSRLWLKSWTYVPGASV